ncbi:MAG: hypothetical protein AB7I37_08340 [Pirellulales bacterium]
MPTTLACELRASLAWLFQDALDLSTVSDASKLDYSQSLANGVAADQADQIWHDQRTVAAGADDDLDLTALASSFFGGSISISLAQLKGLLLVNTSSTAGDKLRLDSSVANACTGPFGGSASSQIEVGADSPLLLASKKDGWPVTGGSGDILRIHNPGGNAITYKIVLVGTSS